MKSPDEYDIFDSAMDTILKARPETVKAAMEREKEERAEERKTKRSASRVSGGHKS